MVTEGQGARSERGEAGALQTPVAEQRSGDHPSGGEGGRLRAERARGEGLYRRAVRCGCRAAVPERAILRPEDRDVPPARLLGGPLARRGHEQVPPPH